MRLVSPLRYPGSKRKFAKYFNKILAHNKLSPKIVIEPFVGGGSFFLGFLNRKSVKRVIIADKDELVSSFWQTLFFDTEYLIDFIRNTDVTVERFDYFRNIAKHSDKYTVRERAKTCLFLNRTSFSGILNDSAGPIGGREQKSDYKIDCRFGKDRLINRIERIAEFKEKIVILSLCWKETIQYCLREFAYKPRKLLFYLDPPFYKKAEHLYRNFFCESEHEILRDYLVGLKQPWILSYDKAKEIEELYSAFKRIHVRIPYSINSPAKRLENELIISPLDIPLVRERDK